MGLKHQAAVARKWRSAIRQVKQHFPACLPPLLFLTDPDRAADPLARINILPAGAGVIYRHFGSPDRVQQAELMAELCARQSRPLLISADPALACFVNAAGVHWPEARLAAARAWRGSFALQTASAHSRAALVRAAHLGMDAVLLSTAFASDSPSAGRPIGPVKFRRYCQQSPLPTYGLGGLNHVTASRIARFAGLSGVSLN